MGTTAYLSIGILFALVAIGLFAWLSRNVVVTEKSKRISIAIEALQDVRIILFFKGLLGKISQTNVYIAFGICSVISIICFLLSIWS